jgi:sialate O-acetylesterase
LKLNKELGIPVGLIHSSWGGTPAESWTSGDLIGTVPGYESFASQIEENKKNLKEFEAFLSKLENIPFEKLPKENPFANLNLKDSAYLSSDISTWKEMALPQTWENAGLPGFDGIVWFVRDFEYDGSVYPEGIEFLLGPVDDMDATYLNGVKIGSVETDGNYQLVRQYKVPEGLLKKGTNRIAVKVTDTRGGGGIYGKINPAIVKGEKILVNLGGVWKYKPAAILRSNTIYVYGDGEKSFEGFTGKTLVMNEYTPTMLYNAMIAPLVNYTIEGTIWYQGESNVGRGKQYESLFPAMITSWRKAWNQGDFPFYYVQIAPFNYGENGDVTTAELRDAQLKTLSLANTGMAVTMDIGNPVNIHPGNKKGVGERLALWALDKTYKKEGIVCSGPLFKNAVFNGNQAEVEFDYGTGLELKGKESFFEIAGPDGVFHPAKATVDHDKIVAVSDKVKEAKQIRYAWCDDCVPNLFNGAGLPASPFKSTLN